MIASSLPVEITNAIRRIVGVGPCALHEPNFSGNEISYLEDCIRSTFVSSVGKYVDKFEADLCSFTGSKYAVAVVNGTAALHISLKLAGVKEGMEVLMPSLTFVATGNAVKYCNAIPHFIDSEIETLGIDPAKLENYLKENTAVKEGKCINKITNRVIQAIIPMHTFGHPAKIEEILRIAGEFHIEVVEDAAESLGSFYKGKHTGTFGKLGTLSFNGNKTITTGGGGAILTSDPTLAKLAKHLTTTARVPSLYGFEHDMLGYNYRLPNINAALGCAQLEQLPKFLEKKRLLYLRYFEEFKSINGVKLFSEPDGCQSNYWLQTLLLDSPDQILLNEILDSTNNASLMTRPVWKLLNKLEYFSECPKMDLSMADAISKRVINIPSSAFI